MAQSLGPVLARLVARQDLELHFVTQSTYVDLLDGLGFASVIAFDRRGGWPAWRRLRAAMREVRADLAVDLQGNWKSALVTSVSGARRRVGAAGSHRQAPASGFLLERIDVGGSRHPAHVATCLLQAVLGLKAASTTTSPRPHLRATSAEVARIDARLMDLGLSPGQPVDVLVLAPQGDNRAWPVQYMERHAQLADHPVLWIQGPAEKSEALPASARVLVQREGEVRDLIALGCRVAESGGRVFGPDVGSTHVMSACRAETHALFGPQDPLLTAPRGAYIVVRNTPPDCMPCRSRACVNAGGPICMEFDALDSHRIG